MSASETRTGNFSEMPFNLGSKVVSDRRQKFRIPLKRTAT